MQQIQITLRLDTPLLLGGSDAKKLESTEVIRPASLRGLFRIFARAAFGYLLGGIADREQRADVIRLLENALLGSAAERGTQGNTYHLVLAASNNKLNGASRYGVVPKPNNELDKSDTPGFDAGQTQIVSLVIPRRSLEHNASFAEALSSIVWLGLTSGSLGKRSRRGYGSIAVVEWNAAGGSTGLPNLPMFGQVQDQTDLAEKIAHGFEQALTAVSRWIDKEVGENDQLIEKLSRVVPSRTDVDQRKRIVAEAQRKLPSAPTYARQDEFFQLAGLEHVYIGRPAEDNKEKPWLPPMGAFNAECSKQLNSNPQPYRDYIGRSDRLASPVWLRMFKTDAGHLPVITVSPPNPSANAIVTALTASVNATPISELLKPSAS